MYILGKNLYKGEEFWLVCSVTLVHVNSLWKMRFLTPKQCRFWMPDCQIYVFCSVWRVV